MTRVRSLPKLVTAALALGLVLGCLAVEAGVQMKVAKARRALPHVLAETKTPEAWQGSTQKLWRKARVAARKGRVVHAAETLEHLATEMPSPETHKAAATAMLATGRVDDAARHAQFAARLDTADTQATL